MSEKKKEKATWSKAFRKNQTVAEDSVDYIADAANTASSNAVVSASSRTSVKGSVAQPKIQPDLSESGSADSDPTSGSISLYGVLLGLTIVGVVGGLVAFYVNRRRK